MQAGMAGSSVACQNSRPIGYLHVAQPVLVLLLGMSTPASADGLRAMPQSCGKARSDFLAIIPQ